MNGEDVKSHLRSKFGETFYTLAQEKPFTLEGIDGNLIIILTSTGNSRNVPLDGTIDAYKHVMNTGELLLSDIREHNYSDWNPAYIAALLASFPDIEFTTRPIKLSRNKREHATIRHNI